MTLGEKIALIVTIVIIALAIFYIIRSKKKGRKCIGCPYCSECSKNKSKNIRCNNKSE